MSKHTNPLAIVLGECIARMLYKKPDEASRYLYSLKDFGGEYDSYSYRGTAANNGTDNDVSTSFNVGEFPLVLEHTFDYDRDIKPAGSLGVTLLPQGDYIAQKGDKISVTWMFPEVEWGISQTNAPNWYIAFYGESGAYYSSASYDEKTKETSFRYQTAIIVSVISNPVISTIVEDGKVVGFTASGDVAHNIKKLHIGHSSNLDYLTGSGTTVVTYKSVDDFKMTIERGV